MNKVVNTLLIVTIGFLSNNFPPSVTDSNLRLDSENEIFIWDRMEGPEGGNIIGFGVSEDFPSSETSFIAVDGDIYSSQIGSSDWEAIQTGNLPEDWEFTGFAMSPNYDHDHTLFLTGYLLGSSGGIYVSTDSGVTWNLRKGEPTDIWGLSCHKFASSPIYKDDSVLLVGCNQSIFRTTNGGMTWDGVLSELYDSFQDIEFSPGYSTDNTVFATSISGGIYRSINKGQNWSQYINLQDVIQISLSPGFPIDQIIYVTTRFPNFKTNRNGSWETLSLPAGAGEPIAIVTSPDYVNNHMVFAGTTSGTYKSNNGGSDWIKIQTPPMNDIKWSPNYVEDRTGWMITQGIGLLVSHDGGDTWNFSNGGLTGSDINDLDTFSPNGGNELVFASTPGGGVYIGNSIGNHWDWIGEGITNTNILSIAPSSNFDTDSTLFVGSDGSGVFRTYNRGASWENIGPYDSIYPIQVFDIKVSPNFEIDQVVIAGTNQGTYRSTNRGDDWVKFQGVSTPASIEFSPDYDRDHTIVLGTNGGVIISTDSGQTWEYSNEGLPYSSLPYGPDIVSVIFSPNYFSDNTIFVGTSYHGIYKSLDNGQTWIAAYNGMIHPFTKALAIDEISEDSYILYAAASINSETYMLYKSLNQGEGWTPIELPFSIATEITHLKILSTGNL